jgi:hypothetical protein
MAALARLLPKRLRLHRIVAGAHCWPGTVGWSPSTGLPEHGRASADPGRTPGSKSARGYGAGGGWSRNHGSWNYQLEDALVAVGVPQIDRVGKRRVRNGITYEPYRAPTAEHHLLGWERTFLGQTHLYISARIITSINTGVFAEGVLHLAAIDAAGDLS